MTREQDRSGIAWPIAIVVGLSIVVVANAIMISLALWRPSIPATRDHWAESLDWDRELERRAHSRELGWTIGELARDQQALVLSIVDAEQRPLTGLQGTLSLRRADRGDEDRVLTLIELGPGRYRSEQPIPSAGHYQLSFALRDGQGHEFDEQRWVDLDQLGLLGHTGAT